MFESFGRLRFLWPLESRLHPIRRLVAHGLLGQMQGPEIK